MSLMTMHHLHHHHQVIDIIAYGIGVPLIDNKWGHSVILVAVSVMNDIIYEMGVSGLMQQIDIFSRTPDHVVCYVGGGFL